MFILNAFFNIYLSQMTVSNDIVDHTPMLVSGKLSPQSL